MTPTTFDMIVGYIILQVCGVQIGSDSIGKLMVRFEKITRAIVYNITFHKLMNELTLAIHRF